MLGRRHFSLAGINNVALPPFRSTIAKDLSTSLDSVYFFVRNELYTCAIVFPN